MTVDQMLLRLSHKTGLTDAASSAEREFLIQALNTACRQTLQDTACYVTEIPLNLVANTSQYTVSTSILRMVDYVANENNTTSLGVVIRPAGDVLDDRRIGLVGSGYEFTIVGPNIMVVSPTPTASESWRLYVVPDFTDFVTTDGAVNITTQTNIPVWALRAPEFYALIQAAEKNQAFQSADFYTQRYLQECGLVRKRSRQMAGRRLAPGRVGYQGRITRPPDRNDTYPPV